jgi:hypothetical protein
MTIMDAIRPEIGTKNISLKLWTVKNINEIKMILFSIIKNERILIFSRPRYSQVGKNTS